MAKRRAHGEGSVYQTADGRWRGAISTPEGRRYVSGRTRREAVQRLLEARTQQPASRELLAHYLAAWLEHARTVVTRRTADGYADHIRLYVVPAIGDVPLDDLSPEHVQRMLNDLSATDLSPATVSRVLAALRSGLSHAERLGLVTRNVARLARPPREPRREMDPLSVDDAQRLLKAVENHRLRALYAVALGLGLRQGEALGLRWADLDLDAGTVMVRYQLQRRSLPPDAIMLTEKAGLVPTKTHRSRRAIAVPASVVREFAQHRERQLVERDVAGTRWVETGLVFVTAHGTPLDGHRLTRQLHRILAKADLPDHHWHDLRHSCGSILAANGVPLPEIQRILGHAEIATTGIYLHSLTDSQRAAAARMQDVLFGGSED